jgi:hypothetical protein
MSWNIGLSHVRGRQIWKLDDVFCHPRCNCTPFIGCWGGTSFLCCQNLGLQPGIENWVEILSLEFVWAGGGDQALESKIRNAFFIHIWNKRRIFLSNSILIGGFTIGFLTSSLSENCFWLLNFSFKLSTLESKQFHSQATTHRQDV